MASINGIKSNHNFIANNDNHSHHNSINECEEQNIWSSILTQVQTSATNKLPSNKSIIVLGDNDSGKTSLIAKMQGIEDTRKGSGLEYHHLLVRDEYRDEQTQCGVWILDGNCSWNSQLLKFALNDYTIPDTTILLTASMTKPWDIINSLEKWTKVLDNHLKNLNLNREVFNSYKQQNLKRYLEYISPGDEMESLVNTPVKFRSNSDLEVSFKNSISCNSVNSPLPEGVLTHNLGIDIIVVITKTDYMSTLEKEFDYKEESFDFIQQAIRKFCLKFGASLLYVSVKVNKNCDLLYKYLVHRIYGLKFKTPALVVEKDAVFIPTGWDNEKKIAILYENIQSVSPDDDYNEVIGSPIVNKPLQKEVETTAEDDQVFLLKMQSQLNQQMPVGATPPTRTTPIVQKQSERRTPINTPPTGAQIDGSKGTPGGEGVLQTFFNSLLNRKSGSPGVGSPRTPNNITDNRMGVQAELDRMIGSNSSTPTHKLNLSATSSEQ
ncbi:cytoplasmic dynein 1 light intermediate chain 2-like [Oppia nitens]|uniref:cytoplasmic dynein 1 light intermediate chain 2-like n=1 Tax=Oppia nitens TaxID=1686743 RepID=UPI0023DB842C|nr:cytoplasmic dynein 1 light intermediate chain 2-like [Oppia nitens]